LIKKEPLDQCTEHKKYLNYGKIKMKQYKNNDYISFLIFCFLDFFFVPEPTGFFLFIFMFRGVLISRHVSFGVRQGMIP